MSAKVAATTATKTGVKRVAIATMGCKVNAYDTAHLRGRLEGQVEVVPFDHEADVYVINTCTVTNRSDSEARNLIRRSKRKNSEAVTIVTGCYAQTNADELSAVEGVDYIFGNGEKGKVADVIQSALRQPKPVTEVGDVQALTEVRHLDAAMFDGRTRAFLKVQEGCLYRCTYCIIPYSRGGASRSVPLEQVIAQAEELAAGGYRELVLTGVHMGSWGHEWNLELADLVGALAEVSGLERLRISSIDSPELHPRLVELIAHHPKVAKHAHVCLQSGSDTVLQRMGRVYDADSYRKAVEHLVAQNEDICIGTDVIVGFPGETEEEFLETERLMTETPIHHFHVFSFSPRDGTPAAALGGRMHGDIVKERSRRLRDLGARKKAEWAAKFTGRVLPVLFEKNDRQNRGRGKAMNYLEVGFPHPAEQGMIAKAEIVSVDGRGKATGVLR